MPEFTGMPEMPWHQRVVIVVASLVLLGLIFELVRKRRLREEYSWLWMLTGVGVLVLAWLPQIALIQMANFFGSENPPAAIFFLGFCFVALLCLQFSVRLSRMTEHVKTLAQKIALLESDLETEFSGRRRRSPNSNVEGERQRAEDGDSAVSSASEPDR